MQTTRRRKNVIAETTITIKAQIERSAIVVPSGVACVEVTSNPVCQINK